MSNFWSEFFNYVLSKWIKVEILQGIQDKVECVQKNLMSNKSNNQ